MSTEAAFALLEAAEPAFRPDPARARRYAACLDYWPGKFSEHALLADLIGEAGHGRIVDSGGTGSFVPLLIGRELQLANPVVNGIDGRALPFDDDAFDAGISTHTLEHVPIEDRERFLEALVRVSRRDVYLICPLGLGNVEIDDAKTRFVGNTHAHDTQERVTEAWLDDVLKRHDWDCETRGILSRTVHFLLAMLLPINTEPKKAVCRWVNQRYDVTPPLGDPYNAFVHVRKR